RGLAGGLAPRQVGPEVFAVGVEHLDAPGREPDVPTGQDVVGHDEGGALPADLVEEVVEVGVGEGGCRHGRASQGYGRGPFLALGYGRDPVLAGVAVAHLRHVLPGQTLFLSGRRDSNPRPSPWQGQVGLSRAIAWTN